MKRFKFRLEKVLSLRKHHEQEAKNELGRAISILNLIDHNIRENAVKHNHALQERFFGINQSDGIRGIDDMYSWDNYILRLEQDAQRLAEEKEEAEKVMEEKRILYLEASRELKIMENLKEKQEKEHRKEMFAVETKERDDKAQST